MKALILAAGLGTRLRPHTLKTPKALFPLAGRPLLEHHILRLQAAGCEAVIVNTHHLYAQVEAFVAAHRWDIPVRTRHEPDILGTGGAIRNVRDFWDERPFFVINSDIASDIDLRQVYDAHLRHHPHATLVLVDDPEFNSVTVGPDSRVRTFAATAAAAPPGALTFSGVQVLDPAVLEYIPTEGVSHSIDAFRSMIAGGREVRAFIAGPVGWSDLGTPERYRRAAAAESAREAWRQAFAKEAPATLQWDRLPGDGSDRQWYRLNGTGRSLVVADHGLHPANAVAEVDSFIHIGRHLKSKGLPVPAIYFADAFAGLVFLEDLGDACLQAAALTEPDRRSRMAVYRKVVDALIALATDGAEGFDLDWTYQSRTYDREVILERECRYFCEAFLKGYAGLDLVFDDFADEFDRLADSALSDGLEGFLHRDMQSRNIMLKEGDCYFIDFQGGRLGPVQYDLASLLIDPYVGLASEEQDHLLDYAVERLAVRRPLDAARFRRGFSACALCRNLQILGAFGFLSMVKGKTQFSRYIPAALQGLNFRLAAYGADVFPKLQRTAAQAAQKLGLH
jgi:aminoglycoside/choline kinase family phosphotransferase/GTP:adenosylcobinamide-phosphate guanylyltransferase